MSVNWPIVKGAQGRFTGGNAKVKTNYGSVPSSFPQTSGVPAGQAPQVGHTVAPTPVNNKVSLNSFPGLLSIFHG